MEASMKVTRINEFRAKEGMAEALRSFLTPVIPLIASSPGCLSCQLLQSQDNPRRFVVLEIWDSAESHQASVRNIPPGALAEIMELLDGTPVGEYYHP
jgi:heme oxygenase (mycobilin-producing)